MPYDDPNLKEFDDYYQARSASKRERAENWAIAIGLQKVDGLTPSRYLIDVAKWHIEGDISGAEATRMIDRYYETKSGHDAPEDVKVVTLANTGNAPFYPRPLTRFEHDPFEEAKKMVQMILRYFRTGRLPRTVLCNIRYVRGETF